MKVGETLKNMRKCDISKESEVLSVVNAIINTGGTAEIHMGKDGLIVREVKRKNKYPFAREQEKRLTVV